MNHSADNEIEARACRGFAELQRVTHTQADRLFALIMVVQFVGCILLALVVSPQTWIGSQSKTHIHVYAAIGLGFIVTSLPVGLAVFRPGETLTRHVIAAAQMSMSALLIHFSGGRIETHFHVFGSLAFLSFYRDWRVLLTATLVTSLDHFLRGMFWPQSVFGVLAASRWRWLEHVGWVAFADLFLIRMCVLNVRQMRGLTRQQAELEYTQETIERQVTDRTLQLRESEERYKSFASNIPGIAYRAQWGEQAKILLIEGVSESICGLPVSHFRTHGFEAFVSVIHESDRSSVFEAVERAISTSEPVTIEYRVRHLDGSVRWVSDSMRPVYDNQGRFLYHDGIVLDITERQSAEQERDRQRQVLENIIANIPVFVFWKDRECKYLGCNQLVADIAGHDSPAALVGKDDLNEGMPWTREQALAFQRDDLAVMESGEARLNVEETQTQADGTKAHLLTSKVPLRDNAGHVSGLLGLSIDITERRLIEERLDLAIRAANEGLWDWNLVTDEIYFNETTFSMLGYTPGEIESTLATWKSLVHPDDLVRALAATKDHLGGLSATYRCEIRVKAADGSWRWLLDIGEITERDEAGKPTRMMGVHIDITELRQAREHAEAADRAKSEFLSNMSHELRTPLNGVLGYAQILSRDSTIAKEHRSSLDAIRNCGQHLLTLINDVLDLSKIESGRLEIDDEEVDLQRLLTSVRDVLAQRATEKGIALVLDVAPEIPRGVRVDPTKLRQVLVNLAGNAIKFTDEGSVTIRVTEPEIEKLRFEVEDTGIGMSASEISEVFDPFKQAAAGKAAGGTGLGLAISRRVIEAMGGEMSAESTPGAGSTFAFELRLTEVELGSAEFSEDLDDATILRLPKGREVAILIADDRAENRDILRQFLQAVGIRVLLACDGEEALSMLARERADAVLMDVRMPKLNGLDATRRIRQDPTLDDLKVIAVSASVFENQRDRISEAGCDDFLGKPLRAAELYSSLAKHLGLELILPTQTVEGSTSHAVDVTPEQAQQLAQNLDDLAASGDVTALREMAEALRQMGGAEASIGNRVLELVREFNFGGIREYADQIRAWGNA